MKNRNKDLITLISIYVTILVLFFIFYFLFFNDFFARSANQLAYNDASEQNGHLIEIINQYQTAYEQDTLSNWDTYTYATGDILIDDFYNVLIRPLNEVFEAQSDETVMIILTHPTQSQVTYYPFETFLLQHGYPAASEYFIDISGSIFYTEDTQLIGVNFYALMPNHVVNRLDRDLSVNRTNYVTFDEGNETYVLSYLQFYDMVYIRIANQNDYMILFESIYYAVAALFILLFIVFIAFTIYLSRKYNKQQSLIEKFANQPFNRIYIAEVGGLGQLIDADQSFLDDIWSSSYRFIQDLNRDEKQDIPKHLKELQSFTYAVKVKNDEMTLRFLPIKYGRKYLLIIEDATKLGGFDHKYKQIALTNQESHIPNLVALYERLETLDYRNQQSIVIFDIVGFGRLTQTIGRSNISILIQNLIEQTKKQIASFEASLYHDKGDLFFILFENIENFQVIETWTKEFIEWFRKNVLLPDLKTKVKVKAGIIHLQGKVTKMAPTDVIQALMITLDRAKKATIFDYYVYDTKLEEYLTQTHILEQDLRKAIAKSEFELFLQPQYHQNKNEIVSYEALLRWNSSKYTNMSPAVFVKVAEASYLMQDLGRIVLALGLEIAKQLEPYDIVLALNISPQQMMQAGFVNELLEMVEKYQVKPELIAIEITETFLVSSIEIVVEKLQALKQRGFKIHLDDFGTGYSSLTYLKNLPIDSLKIDKQFVDDMVSDESSKAILNMLVTLGKNLKLDVIVEGVETVMQYEALKRMGGTIVQGFLIDRPMPVEEAIKKLKKRGKKRQFKEKGVS